MSEGSSSTQVELRLDWGAWPGRTTSTFGTSRRLHDAGHIIAASLWRRLMRLPYGALRDPI